ncbi:MAG: hypothetical protein Fur0018_20870 [Anaerolineales bacterium]
MKISVYITSYNQKDVLSEAIESVLAQTLRPHQVIVVDDASTDGSREIIRGYAARYPNWITPVLHERNQGVAAARNSALAHVTGDYVAYLDGDDRYLPHKLAREAEALRTHPGAGIAFSDVYVINPQGQRIDRWTRSGRPPQGDIFPQTFARAFPGRRLFRNELVDFRAWQQCGAGFYDPHLRMYEDYDLRIRLTKHLPTVYVDEPLSEYRRHEGSLRSAHPETYLQTFEYLCRKNAPLLDDLPAEKRAWVQRRLDAWRAELLRRMAWHALLEEGPWWQNRRRALHFTRQAWRHEKRLPLPFLVRLFTPFKTWRALQKTVHTLRARNPL